MNHRFFAGAELFTISLAIHGLSLFSLDRVMSLDSQRLSEARHPLRQQPQGSIQFEFIEAAPQVSLSKPPEDAKKISDRDALNQDSIQDKSIAQILPSTSVQGLSDQLVQRQGSATQVPAPKIEPEKAVEATSERPTEENKKEASIVQIPSPDTEKIESKMPPPREPKPLIEPKPERMGSQGQDKIIAQEMSKVKSNAAALFGVTSFEATGSGMGAYMKNLKEKIWLSWFPYLAFQYPQDFRGADVVISFTLNAKGEVKILKVIESRGSKLFASYCMEAIQKVPSFGPVPEEILVLIGKDELEIRFGFHYR